MNERERGKSVSKRLFSSASHSVRLLVWRSLRIIVFSLSHWIRWWWWSLHHDDGSSSSLCFWAAVFSHDSTRERNGRFSLSLRSWGSHMNLTDGSYSFFSSSSCSLSWLSITFDTIERLKTIQLITRSSWHHRHHQLVSQSIQQSFLFSLQGSFSKCHSPSRSSLFMSWLAAAADLLLYVTWIASRIVAIIGWSDGSSKKEFPFDLPILISRKTSAEEDIKRGSVVKKTQEENHFPLSDASDLMMMRPSSCLPLYSTPIHDVSPCDSQWSSLSASDRCFFRL